MPPVSPTNNLAYTHPEITSQLLWVYESDGVTRSTKTAKDVSAGSSRKAEFRCDKSEIGHGSHSAMISNKVRGSACPLCGRKARGFANSKPKEGMSLADSHPEIASLILCIFENDGVTRSAKTPKDVSAGSKFKAEFQCDIHGLYYGRINSRTNGSRRKSCPTCGRKAQRKSNSKPDSIAITHPEIASQLLWFYESDGVTRSTKTAEEVSAGSGLRAEFKCDKPELGHASYTTRISSRTSGTGCATCSGHRVEFGINDLATTHPEIASQLLWVYESDGVTRSAKTAEDVSAGSNLKAEFRCDKPELGHAGYTMRINKRTNGRGCPTCGYKANGEKQTKPKKGQSFAKTHSLLASQLLWVYEPDGVTRSTKTAEDVSAGSSLKAEFRCDKPELGHASYTIRIESRKRGRGCPTCAGMRVELGINDFATTRPELASFVLWIYERDTITLSTKTTQDVTAGTDLMAEFRCDKPELGHDSYKLRIADATKPSYVRGCPSCTIGTTEGLFCDSFSVHNQSNFASTRISLKRQLFSSGFAQIDMLNTDLGVAVEYDGAWVHGGFNNPNKNITLEECLARDIDTTIALIKAGHKVVRIREWSKREKLPLLNIPTAYIDSYYDVTYKSFGKDKDDIDELVKKIIEVKQDWF